MRDAAHGEPVRDIAEAVGILEDQAELAHQPRVLEVLLEGRGELGDEERVVLRQRGDEHRVDREVVLFAVAAAARPAVAVEGLGEEEHPTLGDQGGLRIERLRLTRRERGDAEEEHSGHAETGDVRPGHRSDPRVTIYQVVTTTWRCENDRGSPPGRDPGGGSALKPLSSS